MVNGSLSAFYQVYYHGPNGKIFTDGTATAYRTYRNAKDMARENASAMPNVYFFVKHHRANDPMYSVVNVNTTLLETEI
jgi:hypothetical protein